jgi:hypothetical protein
MISLAFGGGQQRGSSWWTSSSSVGLAGRDGLQTRRSKRMDGGKFQGRRHATPSLNLRCAKMLLALSLALAVAPSEVSAPDPSDQGSLEEQRGGTRRCLGWKAVGRGLKSESSTSDGSEIVAEDDGSLIW